jgi:hypothetical protein
MAQVIIEPDVITDSIDVFAGSEKPSQSRISASIVSLIIPGLGHQYMGNSNSALPYYCAEALFVCGMIFSERYSRRMFSDSRSYAWMYANVQGGEDGNDYYWQNVGSFMDSDEYNRIMELNRTPEDKYTGENQSWRWSDEYFRTEYAGIRETATRFHVVSSFCIAAMVLNRVVSFIDIRRITKYKGVQGNASVSFVPGYSIVDQKASMLFTAKF